MKLCRKCKGEIKKKYDKPKRKGICPTCFQLERKMIRDFKRYLA